MFASRDAPHSFDERSPRLLLLGKDTSPFSRNAVEASAPFAWLFDPGALNPSTLFEAVEQGIEGIDVERELATGPCVDQLAQLITVPAPGVEQGKDEQLGGSSFQFAVERTRVDI
jgi:hypothetical protein